MSAGSASFDARPDDARAKRNTAVLSVAQALYLMSATTLLTLSGIVGHTIADDKSLATLPVSTYVLGTLMTTVPASFFMRRAGRRAGFRMGALFSILSSTLAAYAIFERSFWLFCPATMLAGVYQAFAQYYRFAAADTASAEYRPKAISWVLLGGLFAAVAGPQVVILTKEAFAPVLFAGSFVASAVASLVALGVLSFVDIPKSPQSSADGRPPRPLGEILRQPKLRIAILAGMVSYASMNFIMTATPLAMVACDHPIDSAAHAIQWHVLAMFAPSFFTGSLIARFGRERVVLAGLILLGCSGLVAWSGIAIWQFNLSMILLGAGWNFGFIGATTMVTDCHRPEERGKVQALNEFLVFSLVATASFTSGKLLHDAGWAFVAVSYLPAVAVAAGLVLLLHLRRREWSVGLPGA